MLILIRAIVITYILAINVYGFLLIYFQKKQSDEMREKSVKDSKIFMSAMLGGAVGVYVSMFVFSHRLQSLLLMIIIPIIIVINAYVLILAFTGNYGFFA